MRTDGTDDEFFSGDVLVAANDDHWMVFGRISMWIMHDCPNDLTLAKRHEAIRLLPRTLLVLTK
jgi:hypothetical protein